MKSKKNLYHKLKGFYLLNIRLIKNLYYKLQSFHFVVRGMKPWASGYWYYKTLTIQKLLYSQSFDPFSLTKGFGYRLDERVVEYPWFFSRLPSGDGKLLDAGSVLNVDFILSHSKLQSKKVFISTLAPELESFWDKGVSYVYEDLRNSCFKCRIHLILVLKCLVWLNIILKMIYLLYWNFRFRITFWQLHPEPF